MAPYNFPFELREILHRFLFRKVPESVLIEQIFGDKSATTDLTDEGTIDLVGIGMKQKRLFLGESFETGFTFMLAKPNVLFIMRLEIGVRVATIFTLITFEWFFT